MKLLALLSLFVSLSSYAQDAEKCLSEAVEVAIAYKINALAEGDCTSLTREKYKSIEETRNEKKRFLRNAIKGLNAGENIPSRLFMDLDENAPDVLLDKKSLCAVVEKKSAQGVKEMMKDCPGGAELLQWSLARQQELDKISEISLAHSCERVQKLKDQACRESKIVYKSMTFDSAAAPEKKDETVKIRTGSGSGSTGARVSGQ